MSNETTTTTENSSDVQTAGIRSTSDSSTYLPLVRLNGRRKIFTNVPVITDGNVVAVLNSAMMVHMQNRAEENYLEKYLRGIQPILNRVKVHNEQINNKIVVNIANEIVTFKTAEFAGEPIQYVSRGSRENVPPMIEKLNDMLLSEGKQSKDMKCAYNMFTSGVGYKLVLKDKAQPFLDAQMRGDDFDEAPFEVYIPDPRTTFVVRLNDVTQRVVLGVTYVYLDEFQNRVRYTVSSDNVTWVIEGTAMRGEKIISRTVHNFGMVTLVEYPCNPVYMGAFEPVLDMLDAISNVASNRMDGIDQFIQALMVFDGIDFKKEDIEAMKELGAVKLPPDPSGRTGRLYYLNEQLDQAQTQTLVDDMVQTVLHIVGMPAQGSGNTSDSSNNGAVILKNGWWSAEARALETEGMWRESETEFLKIILKICKEVNELTDLKLSDVQCKFGRRSYEDKLTKTQSFTMLIDSNVPPIQAYKFSGIDADPEAAANAYEAYQKKKKAEEEESLNDAIDRTRTEREVPTAVSSGRPDNRVAEQANGQTDAADEDNAT